MIGSLLYLAVRIRQNTRVYFGSETGRALLAGRPGRLSKRLLAEIEARPHLYPPEAP